MGQLSLYWYQKVSTYILINKKSSYRIVWTEWFCFRGEKGKNTYIKTIFNVSPSVLWSFLMMKMHHILQVRGREASRVTARETWAGFGMLSVGRRCIIMRLFLVPHDSASLVSRLICFPDLKFLLLLRLSRASLVAQTVKNLPTMQETLVRSLGGEDPLEQEMAT